MLNLGSVCVCTFNLAHTAIKLYSGAPSSINTQVTALKVAVSWTVG